MSTADRCWNVPLVLSNAVGTVMIKVRKGENPENVEKILAHFEKQFAEYPHEWPALVPDQVLKSESDLL